MCTGPVTQTENPFRYTTRITTVSIPFQQQFAVVKQLRRVANYCSEDASDSQKRNGGYREDETNYLLSTCPSLPFCLSIYMLCFHPSEAVTHEQSVIPRVSVLDDCSSHASRQIVSWQEDKAARASSASCLHFPWTCPSISDELVLVSGRRQTTMSPIVLH